ncbi:MAG: MarR family transcriptional regulator [Bacteroidota bacterium]
MDNKAERIPGFILERTAKRMKQYFAQQLKAMDAGITADQWVILQALDNNDQLSQFEIAQTTYKDAPTVTRIIDLLVGKNLLERLPDPKDRRRFRISLTKEGRALIDRLMPMVKEFRRKSWSGLSDEEIDQLIRMLNIVFEGYEE